LRRSPFLATFLDLYSPRGLCCPPHFKVIGGARQVRGHGILAVNETDPFLFVGTQSSGTVVASIAFFGV
jgi:hypothetical protein